MKETLELKLENATLKQISYHNVKLIVTYKKRIDVDMIRKIQYEFEYKNKTYTLSNVIFDNDTFYIYYEGVNYLNEIHSIIEMDLKCETYSESECKFEQLEKINNLPDNERREAYMKICEAGDAVGQELAERNISISELIDLKCPSSKEEKRTPQEVYQSIKENNKRFFEYFDTEEIIKAEAVEEMSLNKDEKWIEREMKITIRFREKDKE
jgi:hypothetical protein